MRKGEEIVPTEWWNTPVNQLNLGSKEQEQERKLENGVEGESSLSRVTASQILKEIDPILWDVLEHARCKDNCQGGMPKEHSGTTAEVPPQNLRSDVSPALGAQRKLPSKAKHISKLEEMKKVKVGNRARVLVVLGEKPTRSVSKKDWKKNVRKYPQRQLLKLSELKVRAHVNLLKTDPGPLLKKDRPRNRFAALFGGVKCLFLSDGGADYSVISTSLLPSSLRQVPLKP